MWCTRSETSIPYFTVAANIVAQKQLNRWGIINDAKRTELAKKALDSLGLLIVPEEITQNLSVAQMQLVEIAKAIVTDTKVLLLDKPTASISGAGANRLFEVVRKL